VNTHLYIEGGESKEDQIRCREGFRKLIEKAGFLGKMPRLSACGGRGGAFDDFKTALLKSRTGYFVAMLIDSEDPLKNVEKTWEHLKIRDGWEKPSKARDEQVLFMTTCMETWIVADRGALRIIMATDCRRARCLPWMTLRIETDIKCRTNLDMQPVSAQMPTQKESVPLKFLECLILPNSNFFQVFPVLSVF